MYDDDTIKVLFTSERGVLPQYKTEGAAGADLSSSINVIIPPSKFLAISTGLSLEMDSSWEAQIRPRSGLAATYGVTVLNAPGTIDSDFRGELKVILINHGSEDFVVKTGDRIAQIVFAKVSKPKILEVKALSKTTRGKGGFGSTGI